MSDMSISLVNQFNNLDSLKADKKTTLEKAVNFSKEQTKEGSFVVENPVPTAGIAGAVVISGIAANNAVAKARETYPFVEKTIQTIAKNEKLIGAGVSAGASFVLAEDAVKNLKNGNHLKGGLEAAGATVTGLGAVELVGRQLNIPIMNKALTGIPEFALSKLSLNALNVGMSGVGGTVAADGVRRLFTEANTAIDPKESKTLNKLIGGTEFMVGSQIMSSGFTELVANSNSKILAKVADKSPLITATATLAVGSAALVKDAIDGIKENGSNSISTAELTAATIGTLGATQLVASEVGIKGLSSVLKNTWKPVIGVGFGLTAVKMGEEISRDKNGAGVTAVRAFGACGLAGTSLVILGLSAVESPMKTLVSVGAATAGALYIHTKESNK